MADESDPARFRGTARHDPGGHRFARSDGRRAIDRRSLGCHAADDFAHVDRLNLAGVFTTFDFAQPEMSTPQRFETTVPEQALFLMNSPLVIEQARQLAAAPDLTGLSDDAASVLVGFTAGCFSANPRRRRRKMPGIRRAARALEVGAGGRIGLEIRFGFLQSGANRRWSSTMPNDSSTTNG